MVDRVVSETMPVEGIKPPHVSQGDFVPYPIYRDSGVEWLREIPAHWEVKRLKHLGELQAGAGFPDDEQGDRTQEFPFFKVGDMGRDSNRRGMVEWQHTVSSDTASRLRAFIFPPSTIVFAKVGAALLLNRRRMLTSPSCIDNNMMGFIPRVSDPSWMMYWLSGLDLGKLANPGAVPSVNEGQIRDQETILPPLPEQRAIATFLDRETAKIDALVAKKERLLELLQEKRTALISRVVTKGLDPDVSMKDSGVEWLGEVPAHWDVKPLRWTVKFQRGHDLPSDIREEGTVPLISSSGPSSTHSESIARAPGIVTGRYGTIGKFHLVCKDYWPLNTTLYSIDLYGNDPHFLHNMLAHLSPLFLLHAAKSAVPGVDRNDIHAIHVVVPPLAEQHSIASHLDRETAKLDSLVAKVREVIERLKELRVALISAAVTGRIDVREEAA